MVLEHIEQVVVVEPFEQLEVVVVVVPLLLVAVVVVVVVVVELLLPVQLRYQFCSTIKFK